MRKRKPINDWIENCLDVFGAIFVVLTVLLCIPILLKFILVSWGNLFTFLGW